MPSPDEPDVLDSIGALQQFAEGPTLITGNSASPDSQPPGAPLGEHAGQVIGNFTLIAPIGDGGFGTVWRARQTKPVDREVALKIIKMGMDTREVVARFEQERQAVAMMDHPHVAKVFDAGITPSGRPYFAMEWVNGEPITTWCDKRRLKIAERLHLFMDVCRAVQHAHQKGVIHRDLKPSNILVTEVDGKPMPKLIDFGVAKALDVPLTEGALNTLHGQIIGTPEYMSPEQAEGDPRGIDTRTDIFALGVLLYELLTGTTPLDSRALRSAGVEAMCRLIRETEPELPSKRVTVLGKKDTTVAETRRTSSQTLQRNVTGDLDWIVLHALQRDKLRRYASVAALLDDIERHQRHEPVSVGPPSLGYRLHKLYLRHKLISSAACFTILAILVGGGLATWQWREAVTARTREATARQVAEHARGTAEGLINQMLFEMHDQLEPIGKLDLLDQVSQSAQRYFASLPPEQRTSDALFNEGVMWSRRGDVLKSQGDMDASLDAYRKCREVFERLALQDASNTRWQNGLGASIDGIGDALMARGDTTAALEAYSKGFEVAERLARLDPDNTKWQCNLIVSLWRVGRMANVRGDMDGALAAFRRGSEIAGRLVRQDPGNSDWQGHFAGSLERIGGVLADQGDLSGALEAYGKCEEIVERLVRQDPTNTMWQRALAASHSHKGDVLRDQGDLTGALAAHREGLLIAERLSLHDATNTEWQLSLSERHLSIGTLLWNQGDLSGALEAYRKVLGIREHLVGQDGSNKEWQSSLAECHSSIGRVLRAQGNLAGALEAHHKALEIRQRLVLEDAGNMEWQSALAASHENIGHVLGAQDDPTGTLAAYRKGLEIRERLTLQDAGNVEWQSALAVSHENVGHVLSAQGDSDGAVAAYRKSFEIIGRLTRQNPNNNQWQRDASRICLKLGAELADKEDPGSALQHFVTAKDHARRLLPKTVAVLPEPEIAHLFGAACLAEVTCRVEIKPATLAAELRGIIEEGRAPLHRLKEAKRLSDAQAELLSELDATFAELDGSQ